MRAFIISEKVNGIEKQTQTLLKTLVNMLIIDSDEKQQKMQTHEQIKYFSQGLTVLYSEFFGHTGTYSYCVLKKN